MSYGVDPRYYIYGGTDGMMHLNERCGDGHFVLPMEVFDLLAAMRWHEMNPEERQCVIDRIPGGVESWESDWRYRAAHPRG